MGWGWEINPHLILARSLDKIKAFAEQRLAEYRSLVPLEEQPDTGTFLVSFRKTPVLEAAPL